MPFQFKICKNSLKTHISSVHEIIKPHKCSLCDYSASEKGHLKYHISAKHDGEKPFECNFCDAKFPAKGSRNKHLKDVHKIESVPKDPVETNNTHDPLEI